MPKIAICLPSRGLVQSRTIESIQVAIRTAEKSLGVNIIDPWFWSHDKPIPEAQNYITDRALESDASLIWYIEEDMVIPAQALNVLLPMLDEPKVGASALEYPIGEKPIVNTVWRQDGEIVFSGMGCMLVKRECLVAMDLPRFRSDRAFQIVRDPRTGKVNLEKRDWGFPYGGQDIWLGFEINRLGWKIVSPDPEQMIAGHLRLRVLGDKMKNNGCHIIEPLGPITKWNRN